MNVIGDNYNPLYIINTFVKVLPARVCGIVRSDSWTSGSSAALITKRGTLT